MPAVVVADHLLGQMVEVRVSNDPFTSYVDHRQLEKITRKGTERTDMASAKELRKAAKAAGIDGWEDMDRDELEAAVAEAGDEDEKPAKAAKKGKAAAKSAKAEKTAKKSTKKAAPTKASKKAAKDDDDDEDEDTGPNPFRKGSNLYLMTDLLMAGGKRSAMVKKLAKKIELNPRTKKGKDFDPEEEIDYRLVRVCQTLANEHGFTIEKDGRGKDQTVTAVPPS